MLASLPGDQVPSTWDMRVKVVAMVEEVREKEGDVGMVVT